MSDKQLRRALIRLASEKSELRKDILPLLKQAGEKLDSSTRKRVNKDLTRSGLDGNGSFRSTGDALNRISQVLNQHGMEAAEAFTAYELGKTEGNYRFAVAFSDPDNAFNPTPISNSLLVMSWYERESGNYEVVAYLS
jgi:hypothetical protein